MSLRWRSVVPLLHETSDILRHNRKPEERHRKKKSGSAYKPLKKLLMAVIIDVNRAQKDSPVRKKRVVKINRRNNPLWRNVMNHYDATMLACPQNRKMYRLEFLLIINSDMAPPGPKVGASHFMHAPWKVNRSKEKEVHVWLLWG